MLKFKRMHVVPPGGQYFYQVEGGPFFVSRVNMQDLVGQVTQWHSLNKIPVPENLPEKIEDFICRNVADGFCCGDDDGQPRSPWRHVTYWQLVRRTRELMRGQGLTTVDAAEARSATCLSCINNMRHMCTTCNGLDGFARGLVGGKTLRGRDYMGACSSVGALLAAVLFRADDNLPYEGELPAACWIRRKV